jgi:hypothetical protein
MPKRIGWATKIFGVFTSSTFYIALNAYLIVGVLVREIAIGQNVQLNAGLDWFIAPVLKSLRYVPIGPYELLAWSLVLGCLAMYSYRTFKNVKSKYMKWLSGLLTALYCVLLALNVLIWIIVSDKNAFDWKF